MIRFNTSKNVNVVLFIVQGSIDTSRALAPWAFDLQSNHWLSGFIDGDGCFQIYIPKKQGGAHIYLLIDLNFNSKYILDRILASFQGGNITVTVRRGALKNLDGKVSAKYRTNFKVLDLWVKYLDSFPLCSSKFKEYLLWKQAYSCRSSSGSITHPAKLSLLRSLMKALKSPKLNA